MDRRTTGYLLILILAVGLLYLTKAGNPFQWDDFHFISNGPSAFSVVEIPGYFTESAENLYRPLRSIVYALLASASGGDPLGYHLAGICFHLCTCAVLFLLILRLYQSAELAFAAALLFGVHPVNTGRVVNITGSLDIPGVTLSLATLYLFVRAFREGNAVRSRYALSLLVYGAACFYSEESVTVVPLVFLAALAFVPWKRGRAFVSSLWVSLPFAAVFFAYFVARSMVLGMVGRLSLSWPEYFSQVMAMGRVFWLYVLRLFFPISQSPSYGLIPGYSFRSDFPLSFLVVFLVLLAVVLFFLRNRTSGFAGLWFFVALLPFSNLLPAGDLMADRYCYHASAAFALSMLLAARYATGPGGRADPRARAVIAIVASVFALLTAYRIHLWSDPYLLWSNAVRNAPSSYAARVNLGNELLNMSDPEEAARQYAAAVAIDPEKPLAYSNLGYLHLEEGRLDKARTQFQNALDADGQYTKALVGLADIAVMQGDLQSAEDLSARALAIDENNVDAHNVFGYIAARSDRPAEAIEHYEFVVKNGGDPRVVETARENIVLLRRIMEGQ